jgi:hypothetical protein
MTGQLLTLDRALEQTLPALLALLNVPVDDAVWHRLDPPQRRQLTLDAVVPPWRKKPNTHEDAWAVSTMVSAARSSRSERRSASGTSCPHRFPGQRAHRR